MRVWRNWQTRQTQDLVSQTWGFKSSHPHQKASNNQFDAFLHLTFVEYLCIIKIGNDNSTNVVLPDKLNKLTSTLQRTDVSFYYLCSCLSTQFLYRTAVKATFNVKDNINDIIKNSITLTINITTSLTIFRIIGGNTTSVYYHFLCQPVQYTIYNKSI